MESERKIIASNMILEVTRRCNMVCAHCLRGTAENMDMPEIIVDRVLESVCEIQSLVFSGGEPFMNCHIMRYMLQKVKEMDIPVYSIYVVTNGKEVKNEYLELMDDWVLYVLSCCYATDEWLDETAHMPESGEELRESINYSGVSVSRDRYHESIPTENYLKWRLRSYYSTSKESGDKQYSLINEGRAKDNGIGEREITADKFFIDDCTDGSIMADELYISSDGNVVPDCNMSYQSIEEKSFGNILERSLWDILTGGEEHDEAH